MLSRGHSCSDLLRGVDHVFEDLANHSVEDSSYLFQVGVLSVIKSAMIQHFKMYISGCSWCEDLRALLADAEALEEKAGCARVAG